MIQKLNINDFNKPEEFDVIGAFKSSVIDLDKKVERPPLAISIGMDDRSYKGVHYPLKFGSFGNISMISGEEKSRKSFVKSLIEACSIGGKSNNFTAELDIKGYFGDKWIISIDSEQSEYDVWLNGNRIREMVGEIPDNYKILMWREKTTHERQQLLEWLFMESEYRKNLGMVMIDGFVDFIHDFNNQVESKDFTEKLMKYSTQTQCHISGILHLNPGSEKVRGHIGTILGQKCECIMVVKNEGEYSSVRCKVVRGSKPFPNFTIRIDNNWLPYVSDETQHRLI